MTATPRWAVAGAVVLVVTITIPAMLVIIGQREQEVGAITGVTATSP